MKVGIKWHGLKELKADLKTYAGDLTSGTRPIVLSIAEAAARAMREAYPRSGRVNRKYPPPEGGPLADNVFVHNSRNDATSVGIRVTNPTYYAHMFEKGGAVNRRPGRVFNQIFRQAQRLLYSTIKAEMRKYNLRVRG